MKPTGVKCRIGSYTLAFAASTVRTAQETSAQATTLLYQGPDRLWWGVRAGWGFDADLPLRPWPSYAMTVRKSRDLAIGWCGFYVGFTWALPSRAQS